MNTRKIPQIDSIQELARFWDTHDASDFDDELEEMGEPVFRRGTVIPLKLAMAEAKAVRKLARTKGVADAELIHQWVRERIQ